MPAETNPLGFRLSRGAQRWSARETANAIRAARGSSTPAGGELVPLREQDPLRSIMRALAIRDAGATPLIGDDRWLEGHWDRISAHLCSCPAPDGTAWGTFTSGSTGAPRVVLRSAASWSNSFAVLDRLLALREGDAVYAPVPVVSSMTMFQIAHARDRGLEVVLPAGHGVAAADLARVNLAHTTPQGLAAIVTALESGVTSPLRAVLTGGQSLPQALRRRAQALGLRILAYYGAAELSFVAVDEGDGLAPFPGVELALRPHGSGPGPGTLWVRSPYLASGYANDAAGPMCRDSRGWASVGDLAELRGSGKDVRITLRGRADGAILSAGATIVPEDVEAAVRELPGVRDAIAIGLPSGPLGAVPAIVLELYAHAPPLCELRQGARERLPVSHRPRRWFRIGALPRTGSGKPHRAETLRAVMAGEVDRLD